MKDLPRVSIAVVAYNAAAYLPRLLSLIQAQDYPAARTELLLVDGRSRDDTRRQMEAYAATAPMAVQVLDNPGRTLPAGCNVALRAYTGDLFLRLDAHCLIPEDFIRRNVEAMAQGHDIVGGFVGLAPPADDWRAVLSALDASRFCGGAARFRNPGRPRHVDTLAFAMYRRGVYEKVGFYDERLHRTEDNDMVYRMKKAGYRFYYTPAIQSFRYPRETLGDMLRQKWSNGYWIGHTLFVQPHCFTLRHFVPVSFVLALLLGGILALAGWPWPGAVLLILYGLLDLGFTAQAVLCMARGGPLGLATLPFLFPLVHLCYGVGTLWGLRGARALRRQPMLGPLPPEVS